MKKPYIVGEYRLLFAPKTTGNYVNDHTIVKGSDGFWHLFGITSFASNSYEERYFVHAVGKDFLSEWDEKGKSIDTGTLAWAPCVIEKDKNYYMFYGPSPTKAAVSFDMYEWFGTNVTLRNEPLFGAHRDHFVLRLSENRYLMYAVGVYKQRGAVSCFSSSDLLHWEFVGYALTSGENAPLTPAWGAFESPFVVKKENLYYLFVTYTDCRTENYHDTLVFCSSDPTSFGEYDGECGALPIARIHAHAPEIIEENGKYYITTCGWRGKNIPNEGAVSVAELGWKE